MPLHRRVFVVFVLLQSIFVYLFLFFKTADSSARTRRSTDAQATVIIAVHPTNQDPMESIAMSNRTESFREALEKDKYDPSVSSRTSHRLPTDCYTIAVFFFVRLASPWHT